MKKLILIIGVIVLVAIIVAGTYLFKPKPAPPLPGEVITPSQAYQICCPTEPIWIQGNLTRTSTFWPLVLSDDKNSVFIDDLRDSGLSLIDTLIFYDNLKLQKGGVVEVKVKGNIRHSLAFCDMAGCQDIVTMTIDPEEVEFIKEVGCWKKEGTGRIHFETDDCFDVSISLEDAYKILFSSEVCTEEGRKPSGSFSYDTEKDVWYFELTSASHPGCTGSCTISKDKVIFHRTCPVWAFGSDKTLEEENIKVKSIEELYDECIEKSKPYVPKYGPAKDEPIGAERTDGEGRVWVKSDDFDGNPIPGGYAWKSNESADSLLTNEAIDELPGGINYKTYSMSAEECNAYLKQTL